MKHSVTQLLAAFMPVFTGLSLPMVLSSCTEEMRLEQETLSDGNAKVQVLPRLRTPEEAINIAATAWHLLDDGGVMSRAGGRYIDLSERINVIRGNSKGRSEVADTLMYVINYADSAGFAIVSALRNTPELIAVTESGNFNSEEVQSNPGLQLYLTNAKEILSVQTANPLYKNDSVWVYDPREPATQEKTEIDTIWIKKVPRRLMVNWGQKLPYNSECPIDISSGNQCVAGCGPVAIAMAFAAARRPSSLKLNYVGSEGEVVLRWDEILMELDHNNDCCSSLTYPVHKRIAQLIREIGHRGDAKYGASATSMKRSDIRDVLKTNGLRIFSYDSWKDVRIHQISDNLFSSSGNNSVLLMRGTDRNTGEGHAWFCDASKRWKLQYKYYTKEGRFGSWELKHTYFGPELCFNYFNWGWQRGSANGYYADMNFAPDNTTYDFSIDVKMLKLSWYAHEIIR